MCQFKHGRVVFLGDMEELIFTEMFSHHQIHHSSLQQF